VGIYLKVINVMMVLAMFQLEEAYLIAREAVLGTINLRVKRGLGRQSVYT